MPYIISVLTSAPIGTNKRRVGEKMKAEREVDTQVLEIADFDDGLYFVDLTSEMRLVVVEAIVQLIFLK